jgi:hypothetical protein
LIGSFVCSTDKRIVKNVGWKLAGEMPKCSNCAIGKGKQKSVLKKSNHVVAEKVGEWLYLDITAGFEELDSDSSIETTRKGYWRFIVDEGTIFRE